ncbi:unnamed protein product [Arabidopsis thaliana]|uniref:(thale cress) hypothetical protein n=1 Tax=Arabidopsis thaliana TaxID=3702 RepID=A0A7G2DVL9_ARATH|nr:unnamed protein product [Arabidopsis thaliana]
MTTTLNHLFDLPGQICHVQCGFCTTILLVSVPFTSLSMVVTTGKEEVAATDGVEEEAWKVNQEKENSPTTLVSSSDNEDEDVSRVYQVVNKPPEKRQRAPSAYNCFIKEEIRRLKAQNPSMAHKEAFSLAAKNDHEESNNGFRERKAQRHSIWGKSPFE